MTTLSLVPARRLAAGCAGVLAAMAMVEGTARACTVGGDTTPSVSADGRLAILAAAPAASSDLRQYAPFVVPGVVVAGQPVRFAEDRARVSLPTGFDRTAYRWDWGDGARTWKYIPAHSFRTGVYRVVVWADVPSYHQWVAFDIVRVRVAPARALLAQGLAVADALGLRDMDRALVTGGLTGAGRALTDVRATWAGVRVTCAARPRATVDADVRTLTRDLLRGDVAAARTMTQRVDAAMRRLATAPT